MPRSWPVRARLYWSRSRNVPLLSRTCSWCADDDVFEVRVGEPGDVRPALAADYSRLKDALVFETGSDELYRELFAGRLVLLNRVPFMDEMKEVIVDGAVVGKLYFDPSMLRWRFRFGKWLARIAVERGLVEVYRLGFGERLRPVLSLGGRRVEPGRQVVVVNSNGEPLAIAYSRGDVVKLQSRLVGDRNVPLSSAPRRSIYDAVKLNEDILEVYEKRAITFLSVMADKLSGKPVLVSYSGGKDSLVSLDLAVKAGLEPGMVFNDTGLELPETHESVEQAARLYGLEVYYASAGDAFWRAVGFFGPPARDYRWCCKVAKLAPLANLARKWRDGALNIVGLRAYESFDRARNPRVWRNRWLPQFLSVTPIREWTQLHVWFYIFRYQLPYNKLYDMGYERIGCFMCPAGFLAEYMLVRERHPELWARWEAILEEWRRRLGLPKGWVTYGLWRWLGPAAQKERLARRVGVSLPSWRSILEKWVSWRPRRAEITGDRVVVDFDEALDPRALVVQAKIVGGKARREEGGRVRVEAPGAEIVFDGRRLEARARGARGKRLVEEAFDALKLVLRWNRCVRCHACEPTCPTGAIRVEDRPVIHEDKCISCRICIDTCTIAEVYFEHIVAPLILDEPLAWKREGKRRISDTVEKEKALIGIKESTSGGVREPETEIPPGVFGA